MKARILFGIFAVVALAQLSVPASMLWHRQRALSEGRAFKFKTAPVDPEDAFRGRYVALRFEEQQAPWKDKEPATNGQKVYAVIETGTNGFARIAWATAQQPTGGDYIQTHVSWVEPKGEVHLSFPFDRFYMEESLAPNAEKAYREHNRRTQQDAYAVVRVLDGLGVIENLYVGGKPIAEAARTAGK
jgi:uncharacterized membrane-anchored protein